MPNAIAYAAGVISGAAVILIIKRCTELAARNARKTAMKDFEKSQRERTDAFNRGYRLAVQDYGYKSDAERFAETFEGRRVKFQMREVRN
jgi:hypothetical protein